MSEGLIPDKALRVMSALRPAVGSRARDGAFRVSIRVVLTENNDVVTLFLLYKKEKK